MLTPNLIPFPSKDESNVIERDLSKQVNVVLQPRGFRQRLNEPCSTIGLWSGLVGCDGASF